MDELSAEAVYAQVYDLYVHDWPGEIAFYRWLIGASDLQDQGVLEIACGTGRVTLQLAATGFEMTGFDLSAELLAVARAKSAGWANVDWVQGDMRGFDLGRKFGWVIVPGHSYQFMVTPDEQVTCLENIRRHLVPGGGLVLHLDYQDYGWLAGLLEPGERPMQKRNVLHDPATGEMFRQAYRWSFERATQTATVEVDWEQLNPEGQVLRIWRMEPKRLHCAFPSEIEHALKRAGFVVEAVYGDFFENPLSETAEQMIWVARSPTE
jgi:SAM-dependent methyltransferase